MSAEFLPLYRLCGTSISSMAHSWKGRLYSVNRFQSAYARRTMILPFSSSRSRTSFSSNCLYCASLTPRAMFSKSMNIASFRSPFIHVVLSSALLSPEGAGLRSLPLYVRRSGPPGRFMICHMKKPDPAVAARVPPGQALTEKWPVLTYARTPRFDPNRWTFRCFGLVERPTSWTWEEFLRLPRVTVRSDIHCVTRWSKLDNDWEGVSARYIVEQVKPRPEAKFVLQHADPDYTTNTAVADLLDDDVVLAVRHNGKDLEPDHGGPMRLVLPKLYFWKSSKWLRAFEFLEVNPPGFWEQNGYHMNADPWTEERYSGQGTRAMQQMRAEAARTLRGRGW